MKQYTQLRAFLASIFITGEIFSQTLSWEQTNGPLGGSVYSLAVDAAERVYAGTYQSGVFRSTDLGNRWTQSNISGTSFNAFAINQNGHVFAGIDGAVYRSTNSGISWQLLTNGLGSAAILSMGVNANDVLFAGSSSGVFRSTNNGDSWSLVGLPGQQVYALTVNQNGHIFAGTYFSGVWRSTDVGDTWSQVGVTSAFIMTLASKSSNTILAGIHLNGVVRSTDNGSTWTQVGLSGTTVRALVTDSSGHILAATTDSGVYRSTDIGTSWTAIGLDNLSLSSLSVSPVGQVFAGAISGGSLIGGSDGGVYRTVDNGNTWSKVGLPNTRIPALTIPTSGPSLNHIFAAVDTIVFRTTDNGDTWLRTGYLPHSGPLTFGLRSLFSSTAGSIFAGSFQWGIYGTTDLGASWTQVGLMNESVHSFVEDSTGHIYASTDNLVYVSTNGGTNWSPTGGSVPGTWLSSLAVNPSGDIFVGLVNRWDSTYVYRSTDKGQTWIGTSMTSYPVMALLITADDLIFAGCAGFFFGGGVFRSMDNGTTWTDVSQGLIDKDIRSLVINGLGHLFAGTAGGVFRSTNNGDLWEPLNSGLTFPSIQSLALDSNGVLFAGTFAGGVFKTTQSTTSIREFGHEKPLSYKLDQNYPNPFNPTTTIGFSLAAPGFVSLRVFDLLGREVATLVKEELPSGYREVLWNAQGFSSGVYFYRLEVGMFSETRKLLLLR